MKPPVRMLDDGTLGPELRRDLEQTHAVTEPYDVAAGERRLAAALVAPALAANELASTSAEVGTAGQVLTNASSSAVLGPAALKLGLGVALAAAVTAGVLAWPERAHPPQAAPRAAVAPRAQPLPAPALAPPRALEPQAARALPPAPERAKPAERTAPARSESAGDAALRREIAQVGRIKQLLASDPRQAYRLAEAGHREFALGMLREEREALAVLALWRAGREPAAANRSRAFLEQYAQSAHREEIERRLRLAEERDARAP